MAEEQKNLNISVVTLNEYELNPPFKRPRLSVQIKKIYIYIYFSVQMGYT